MAGFGNLSGNLWLGLDKIHALTSCSTNELYVFMETFEGETAWAHYSSFSVGDRSSGYQMTISGYTGTAGDAMVWHNNMKFTTHDNDQDLWGFNCAAQYKGGWWFRFCIHTNPNGPYLHGAVSTAVCVNWYQFKGLSYSLKTIEFKVRNT